MTCPGCGSASSADARFCATCGARLLGQGGGGGAGETSPASEGLDRALAAIARTAVRLCGARDAQIMLVEGDRLRVVADHGRIALRTPIGGHYPLDRGTPSGCAVVERRVVHVRDARVAIARGRFEHIRARARSGVRTMLAMPLLHRGQGIGVITIRRTMVRPFSARQIELLRNFADQAAVAIENARLSGQLTARNRELIEALDQQTATSEILRVISRSPIDVQPVLDTVVASAMRLCGAYDVGLFRVDGENLRIAAHGGPISAPGGLVPLTRGIVTARAVIERRTIHVADLPSEAGEFPEGAALARAHGHRTILCVPLLSDAVAIGAIVLRRMEVQPFTGAQIALLQTFADQAVIAIENVRLFTELGMRNRDLTEALEQQTATAEILRVISSSPTDVQPVFDAIARHAVALCDGVGGLVVRYDGAVIRLAAYHNVSDKSRELHQTEYPRPPDRTVPLGAAILDRTIVHVPNLQASTRFAGSPVQRSGRGSMVAVPLLRDGEAIGAIGIGRDQSEGFSDRNIALLQTFADQAVIAIENVRLFTELARRNTDLTEALEQQTATSEILRVISSSPTDVQPVFQTIIANAVRLCDGLMGAVFRYDAGQIHFVAGYGFSPTALTAFQDSYPRHVSNDRLLAPALLECRPVNLPDVLERARAVVGQVELGYRSALYVPIIREGTAIGVIAVGRRETGVFSSTQVKLLETFADQAVIAIENARLLKELQARTAELTRSVEQLTALGEVGRAVGSTLDLDTVLTTIVSRAVQLSGADGGSIYEYDDVNEEFAHRATHSPDDPDLERRRETRLRRGEGVTGQAAIARARPCRSRTSPSRTRTTAAFARCWSVRAPAR